MLSKNKNYICTYIENLKYLYDICFFIKPLNLTNFKIIYLKYILGVPVVRGLLPRMLLLWRNSFPRSAKELESEKARGDAFTWQVIIFYNIYFSLVIQVFFKYFSSY